MKEALFSMKFKLFFIFFSFYFANFSFAQEEIELEKKGKITIMGYTDMGNVLPDPVYPNFGIFLEKRIIEHPQSSKLIKGVMLKVQNASGQNESVFVHEQEIADLIEGLEYLNKVDSTTTPLENFKVTYETSEGFKISATGRVGYLEIYDDVEFIASAKGFEQMITREFLLELIIKLKEVKF